MKACYALVGMQYRDQATGRDISGLVKRLPDQEPVTLIREPTNQYDRNAIQVWAKGEHIGYLAKAQIKQLAIAMDNSRLTDRAWVGKFCARNGERHPLIEVEE